MNMDKELGGLEGEPEVLTPSGLEQNPDKPKALGYDDLTSKSYISTTVGTAITFVMTRAEKVNLSKEDALKYAYSGGKDKGKLDYNHQLILKGEQAKILTCNSWAFLGELRKVFDLSKELKIPAPENLYMRTSHITDGRVAKAEYTAELLGVTDSEGILTHEVSRT